MTTTSEAATEAMQEARKKWIWDDQLVNGRMGLHQVRIAEHAYTTGWRAALAWAEKEKSGE